MDRSVFSKLESGDVVLVPADVLAVDYEDETARVIVVSGSPFWMNLKAIHSVHALRRFQVGDHVRERSSDEASHDVGVIFGISAKGLIAVEWPDGTSNTYAPEDLERV